MKLVRSDQPRLLVADEVGVGKTIEAGLVLKELQARMDIRSILIICPKALVTERKWYSEMKRFDETFQALDGPMLRQCLRETTLEGEWPESHTKAILPFSLFDADLLLGREGKGRRRIPGLLAMDPPPKFDLVIVDEAHHLRNAETYLHQGVRFFCDNAQAVLLLTATPVQLGSQDLFTLLNILRPDVILDPPSFKQMAEPNRFINEAVGHCRVGGPGWAQDARACLQGVLETEWGRLFIRESPEFQAILDGLAQDGPSDAERVTLTRAIEELYTFSPFINRTRRRDIGEFTTRKPETLIVPFTEEQQAFHDDLLRFVQRILERTHEATNVAFMTTTLRRQAASCLFGLAPLLEDMLLGKLDELELLEMDDRGQRPDPGFLERIREDLQALLDRARKLDPEDPKLRVFLRAIGAKQRRENNKALVFSTFRHTLRYLEQHALAAGHRVGLIHGGVPDDLRVELRSRFSLPKENPDALDVLLCSEVGCEGLDFQHCDLLVNYDLPWNPMRIEQRIGRIDRYGQKSETVAILNFVTPNTVDAEIYERCLLRIGVFQHAVGGSEEILGELTREIQDIAVNLTLTPEERERKLRQISDNCIRLAREEADLEAKQSELFGLNVPSQAWRKELEASESCWLSPAALQDLVETYLRSRSGGDGEHLLGEKTVKTLRLAGEVRMKLLEDFKGLGRPADPVARAWEKWLRGGSPTLPVTFDQAVAAEQTSITRLSVFHPLVRQAALTLGAEGPLQVNLCVEASGIPEGSHAFAIYRWKKQGIKPDEVLVAVAEDPQVESAILGLLPKARDAQDGCPAVLDRDALDALHHRKWTEARANHIAGNQQMAEHRAQSLTVSHRTRCLAIQQAISRSGNDKIRIMKQGELSRANQTFALRMQAIQESGGRADIHAIPLVFGTLTVHQGGAQ